MFHNKLLSWQMLEVIHSYLSHFFGIKEPEVLYNILLLINHYIRNCTIKCHGRSMSDNRDLTETFHQKISSHYKVIASAF